MGCRTTLDCIAAVDPGDWRSRSLIQFSLSCGAGASPLLQWLKNAFAVDSPGPLTPSDVEREVVDWLAAAIVRRRLQTPAILLLESSAPLNFLASQLLVLAAPAAELFVHQGRYEALQTLLERRGSVDYICRRIEVLADPPRSLLNSEPGHRAT